VIKGTGIEPIMKLRAIAVMVAAGLMATSAVAQQLGEVGEAFVRAVKERDGEKVDELLQDKGMTLINTRNVNGETALMITVARRDSTWTSFLLSNGADPNIANRNGDTPLIMAARIGYLEAAQWLLAKKARIDEANRMGETPLIIAVQGRYTPVVKYLLSKGANPDKTDNAAGYSARDYAKRDSRNPEILRLIEAATKKPAAATAAK
jgi:ankyrin repeat protein